MISQASVLLSLFGCRGPSGQRGILVAASESYEVVARRITFPLGQKGVAHALLRTRVLGGWTTRRRARSLRCRGDGNADRLDSVCDRGDPHRRPSRDRPRQSRPQAVTVGGAEIGRAHV